jgi:homoserine O-acetyltransferase/O-succinyltransferase
MIFLRLKSKENTRMTKEKSIVRFIFLLNLIMVNISMKAQTEGIYTIDRFAFENGGEIANMKVGYVTWGKLNDAKDNVILLLPGSSNGRHFADAHIGPGKTYDTDKYFVIGVDPIGGGNSSSPKDGMGITFPKYTVRDMARAQYLLITKGLELTKLFAVAGPSMGSFQTLEWGINYPDFVSGLILIVPAARMDRHFAPVADAFESAIKLDPKYKEGQYTENPVDGIRAAALIFLPWIFSDKYFAALDETAYNKLKKNTCEGWTKEWDANSLLWRFNASSTYDASKPFNGDMKKALDIVKAKILILYNSTDRTVPSYLTQELIEGLKDAACFEIPSICGHMSGVMPQGTAEYSFVSNKVKEFLNLLEK